MRAFFLLPTIRRNFCPFAYYIILLCITTRFFLAERILVLPSSHPLPPATWDAFVLTTSSSNIFSYFPHPTHALVFPCCFLTCKAWFFYLPSSHLPLYLSAFCSHIFMPFIHGFGPCGWAACMCLPCSAIPPGTGQHIFYHGGGTNNRCLSKTRLCLHKLLTCKTRFARTTTTAPFAFFAPGIVIAGRACMVHGFVDCGGLWKKKKAGWLAGTLWLWLVETVYMHAWHVGHGGRGDMGMGLKNGHATWRDDVDRHGQTFLSSFYLPALLFKTIFSSSLSPPPSHFYSLCLYYSVYSTTTPFHHTFLPHRHPHQPSHHPTCTPAPPPPLPSPLPPTTPPPPSPTPLYTHPHNLPHPTPLYFFCCVSS